MSTTPRKSPERIVIGKGRQVTPIGSRRNNRWDVYVDSGGRNIVQLITKEAREIRRWRLSGAVEKTEPDMNLLFVSTQVINNPIGRLLY